MPKSNLNRENVTTSKVVRYVKSLMFQENVTQKQVAEKLNISQQSACAKFKSGNFTLLEIVSLLVWLKADPTEIGNLFK